MILTFDQIKEITVGASSIVLNEEGVIRFFKCTDKQNEAWDKFSETLGQRARTTTGIRFDFRTDASTVNLSVAGGSAFDILIDGIITKHLTTAETKELSFDLPKGEKRVTIVFPSHTTGAVRKLELVDATFVKRHEFDTKILFIGDSITQGHRSEYDCISYAYHTTFFFNAESMIQGIGGAFFHETTFDPAIPFEPDTVIIAYGTNDYNRYRTLDELRQHCAGFLDGVKERYGDKKVICLSPIWRGDTDKLRPMGHFDQCREVIIDEIAKHEFIHIDGYKLAPHDPWFYSDAYLHPNATGFGIYAINLIKELQKYI